MTQPLVAIGGREALKLQHCLFPGHRASIGSLVIVFLDGEYRIALEEYLDTTRHLLRETLAEFFVGPDCDLAQQGLHVLANNTLWHVLRRGYFPVNEGDCCHVWETMVGLFLGTYLEEADHSLPYMAAV